MSWIIRFQSQPIKMTEEIFGKVALTDQQIYLSGHGWMDAWHTSQWSLCLLISVTAIETFLYSKDEATKGLI